MQANIKKHLWYYIFFVLIQAMGFLWVILSGAKSQMQFIALFVTTTCYLVFALTHQYIHHNLSTKIVVEYMLVGGLGLTFSLFLFSA